MGVASEAASPAAASGGPGSALSVGLASAAVIAFQLVVMQLLAISQWHHFAYMVISMALLGFGAAGTVLVLCREFLERHYSAAMPLLYLACALTMAGTCWLAGLAGDFDAFLLFFDRGQIALLLASYLAYCLPFFFAGLAITLGFCREVGRIGSLYFANMAGSGAGAILIIGLLWLLPVTRLAGVLSLLPLAAAWWSQSARSRAGAALWLGALVVAGLSLLYPAFPAPSEYKAIFAAQQLPGASIVYQASSPFGLLQVVRAEAQRFAPSLSLQYRDEPPVRDVLFNDGEYFGTLLGRPGAGDRHVLDYTTRALPYALRRPASVLVLMAATGNDVSHALSHGASRISAVEPHRQVNGLLRDRHPEWIDSLYLDPAVRLHGDSARSFLGRRSADRYELIVLPVLESFGGTAGVGALQEQYHLTLEAFREMWEGLADTGLISVTVWQDQPPRATLKVLATWRQLLDGYGIHNRAAHVAAVRSWGTITFLLSKSALQRADRDRIRGFCRRMGFDPLLLEDLQAAERDHYNRLSDHAFFENVDSLVRGNPAALFERYAFDIRPAEDDRPFFSHFLDWRGLPQLRRSYADRELPYLELGFVLAAASFVQILLIAVVLIVLPLFRIGWAGTRRRWTFAYFAALGTGFMFFEIVLIQKLVLYLGQPVYAATAVLATLLICSGTGSWYSSLRAASRRGMLFTGALVAGLILLHAFALLPLLGYSMGWPLGARVVTVFVLIGPPAFFMGMMFPLGLRRLAGHDDSHLPWACAIDSCLSVSATALATLIALESGFHAVMLIAAGAYVVAAIAALRLGTRAPADGVA